MNEGSASKNAEEVLVLQVVREEDSIAFGNYLHRCNKEKVKSKHKCTVSLLIAEEADAASNRDREVKRRCWIRGRNMSFTAIFCLPCITGKLLFLTFNYLVF